MHGAEWQAYDSAIPRRNSANTPDERPLRKIFFAAGLPLVIGARYSPCLPVGKERDATHAEELPASRASELCTMMLWGA
jgi:hypothetical protein